MRKILMLSLFISIGVATFAQRNKVDSMLKLMGSFKEDTTTVKQYNNLALYYYIIDNDSAVFYGDKALELSKKINWSKGQAKSGLRLFDYFFRKGNTPKALSHVLSSLEKFSELKDTISMVECLNRIAGVYQEEEDHERAIMYAKKGYALSKSVNNQLWLSITSHNLGHDYTALKMADSALVYFQESYLLSNAMKKDRGLAYSLYGLGTVHLLMNNKDLALSYLYKSMPFAVKVNDASLLGDIYHTTSTLYDKLNIHDSGVTYDERALTYAVADNTPKRLIEVYRHLAALYKGKDNDKAVKYFGLESALRDSLFTSQRKREIANLTYNEEDKQKELATAALHAKEERKQNIQYAAIAIVLIAFVIIFLALSRSIIVKPKFIEFFGILGLLAVFEFINLVIHPYVADFVNHSPVLILLTMIFIAALLVPVHNRLEKWITHRLVEKNKKIRLTAAKKIIATLEGEQTN